MVLFAPRGRPLATCVFAGSLAFLNNFYMSYSSFYTNTAADSFQAFLNASYVARGRWAGRGLSQEELLWLWSLVLIAGGVGSVLGTLLIAVFCERAGRKATLLHSNVAIFCSILLSVFSVLFLQPELFLLTRIAGAAFATLNFGAFVLFATEFPATNFRGVSVYLGGLFYNVGTNLGMLLGMNAVLGQNLVALISVTLVPSFLAILTSLPLRETPKFLLLNREDKQAAVESLYYYQGEHMDTELLLTELLKERQLYDRRPLPQLLRKVCTQRHLLLATVLSFCALQLVVGPWGVSTTLLSEHFSVEQAQLISTVCTALSLIANVPSTVLAERVSRRKLLLYSGALSSLCLVLYAVFDCLSVLLADSRFRYGILLSNVVYFCSFGIALGTIPFYISGELFPQNFRSIGTSLSSFLALCSATGFTMLILPAYSAMGAWSFFPLFTVPQCVCLLLLWLYLPETRGREVHEIVDELKAMTGARWTLRRNTKCRVHSINNGNGIITQLAVAARRETGTIENGISNNNGTMVEGTTKAAATLARRTGSVLNTQTVMTTNSSTSNSSANDEYSGAGDDNSTNISSSTIRPTGGIGTESRTQLRRHTVVP